MLRGLMGVGHVQKGLTQTEELSFGGHRMAPPSSTRVLSCTPLAAPWFGRIPDSMRARIRAGLRVQAALERRKEAEREIRAFEEGLHIN